MSTRKGMPYPLGVFDAKRLQFDKLPLQVLDFSGAANLVDLDRDYDLALMQLPFVAIPFEQSLLGAYCAETKVAIEPRILMSPGAPFCVGFGQTFGLSFTKWDYCLTIMEKGRRDPLVDWLCTVALHDPGSKHMYRITKQDGIVSDVIKYAKHTQSVPIDTIQLPMLVVEATNGSYYYVHKQKVGLTFPKLIRDSNHLIDLDQFLVRLREGESDLYGVKEADVSKSSHGSPDLLSGGNHHEAAGRDDGSNSQL